MVGRPSDVRYVQMGPTNGSNVLRSTQRLFVAVVLLVLASACSNGEDQTEVTLEESGDTTVTAATSPTTVSENSPTTEMPRPAGIDMAVVKQAADSGNSDIYLVDSEGRETRLTEHDEFDEAPAFSPDGTRLTFDSNRTGDWEVYLVNVDGTGLRQLTEANGQDSFTSWSPQGDSIVFDSERDGDFEVYVLEIASGEISKLTDNEVWDGEPAWSPDGTTIVFHSDRDDDGVFDLYAMRPDGSSPTRVVERGFSPAWSPDGTRIAFAREPEDGSDRDLWILDVESGSEELLVDGDAWQDNPAWSGDGTRIYFTSDRSGVFNVYSIRSDGSDTRLVIGGEDAVFHPAVMP